MWRNFVIEEDYVPDGFIPLAVTLSGLDDDGEHPLGTDDHVAILRDFIRAHKLLHEHGLLWSGFQQATRYYSYNKSRKEMKVGGLWSGVTSGASVRVPASNIFRRVGIEQIAPEQAKALGLPIQSISPNYFVENFISFSEKDEVWRKGLILLTILSKCGFFNEGAGSREYILGVRPDAKRCINKKKKGEWEFEWEDWAYQKLPEIAAAAQGSDSALDLTKIGNLLGHLPAGVIEILKKMLILDPDQRPSWADLHREMENLAPVDLLGGALQYDHLSLTR